MSCKSSNTTNWTNTTNYRKNFTPEEKAQYNAYCCKRMTEYFHTPKGKEKQKELNRKAYQKRKERLLANRPIVVPASDTSDDECDRIFKYNKEVLDFRKEKLKLIDFDVVSLYPYVKVEVA